MKCWGERVLILALLLTYIECQDEGVPKEYDVLVLGAGMSGIGKY